MFAHPFVAKKALRMTRIAIATADSISRTTILDGDPAGGQVDAFRHCYWMALLITKMNPKKALKLGKAHEKGNYKSWKKGLLEDSLRADSILCVMDLRNNTTGIKIGKEYLADTSSKKKSLEQIVLENVKNGKMVMVKKNAMIQPTDSTGRIIIVENYKTKWYVPKVLVNSDYKEPPAG